MRIKLMVFLLFLFAVFEVVAGDSPICSVKTDKKVIALTFDDGPENGVLSLLKLFEANGVKATFFVKGINVKKYPEILKKAFDQGHEIGNHSYSHPNFKKLDPQAARQQVVDTQNIIKSVTGVAPVVFRAPFLSFSPELWKILAELSLTGINANVYTNDYKKEITAEKILEIVKSKAGNGGIVLMHSWSQSTLKAIPEIVRFLKEQGYEFVTVSQLLALKQ